MSLPLTSIVIAVAGLTPPPTTGQIADLNIFLLTVSAPMRLAHQPSVTIGTCDFGVSAALEFGAGAPEAKIRFRSSLNTRLPFLTGLQWSISGRNVFR